MKYNQTHCGNGGKYLDKVDKNRLNVIICLI